MVSPNPSNSQSKKKPKAHRWKNFNLDDKDAIKLEELTQKFEDSTVKLRMVLGGRYNVKYHPFYFTREVPIAKKKERKR